MVEIFKTDIQSKQVAVEILNSLQLAFPNCRVNVDLEDCDKILRVESTDIDVDAIRFHLDKLNIDALLID